MNKMLCLHGKLFTIIRLHSKTKVSPHPRIAVANCTALMSHREAGLQQGHANYTSARHVGGIRAPNPPTSSCQRRRGSASKIKTVFTVPELAGNKTVFSVPMLKT